MSLHVGVVFGSRSCEHEISIISAMQVMKALQPNYHVIPIYIDKDGIFYSHPSFLSLTTFQNSVLKKGWQVVLKRKKGKPDVYLQYRNPLKQVERIDVLFPVLHGRNGEDGCFQGLAEILNIPYVGCDVLASAITMSKLTSKRLLESYGIAVVPYYELTKEKKEKRFFPCILKPDTLGSSIGIEIVKVENEWEEKTAKVLLFDERVIVEPYLESFIEINCSVYQCQGEYRISHLEQVNRKEEILSFHEKYEKEGSKNTRIIAPDLDEDCGEKIKAIAKKVYQLLHLQGVIRIDFFVQNGTIYVNEVNAIPGSYAFYLWNQDFSKLLTDVIQESLHHYARKESRVDHFETDVLFHFNGSKK